MNTNLPFILFFLMLLNWKVAAQVIGNCTELQNMQNNLSGNYILINDIDCSATIAWNAGAGFKPIGNVSIGFSGTFNGGNHTIYNLAVYRPTLSYVGLFGNVSGAAQIMQISLVVVNVTGSHYVGGLVGYNTGTIINSFVTGRATSYFFAGGLVGYNTGFISNCQATGNVTIVSTSYSDFFGNLNLLGPGYSGGLVGYNTGTINNSFATGSLSSSLSSLYNLPFSSSYMGGMVGYNTGPIDNSFATGSISSAASEQGHVGGLVGGGSSGTITNCYATSSISSFTGYVGGLLGHSVGSVNISNCYATGNVLGQSNVGGLVGGNGGPLTLSNCYATGNLSGSTYVGGLLGYNGSPLTISNCYATGNFSGSTYVAGLLAYNGGPLTINNSYATGNVSGSTYAGGFLGYSTSPVSINNSYATGSVSGSTYVGGFLGYSTSPVSINNSYATGSVSGSTYVGGFLGYSTSPVSINNSYATGSVSGSTYVGGFLGWCYSGTITNCYATGNVSGSTYVSSSSYIGGFLGYSGGTSPVSISNSYATGSVSLVLGSSSNNNYVGGFLGYSGGTSPVSISNSYATGNVSGSTYVGGLVGSGGAISNSYATGSISGSTYCAGGLVGLGGAISNSYATGSVSGSAYVGGLVGYNAGGTITNSYATGSVSGSSNVGGLVGMNEGTITNSYATGSVSGSTYVGGLVGWYDYGSISNCYATGNVSGSAYLGGLVGSSFYTYGFSATKTITQCYATGNVLGVASVGGLVGENDCTITNCYAIGSVSGSSNVGGLIGNGTGNAYSSYWDNQTSGQTMSAGGIGRNTADLYYSATYLNWDLNCTWTINEGKNTPQLTQNNCPSPSIVQIQISNCDELQVAVFLYAVDISLTQDIDCTATATWNNGAGFHPGLLTAGSFNGLGHRIVNLMISRTSGCIGLFGLTNAGVQINSVILEQSVISGNTYVGGLVGYNQGAITQSSVTGNITGSGSYIGGLVGYSVGTSNIITQCYAAGSVWGSTSVGGLVGCQYKGSIIQSYATSSVWGSTNVGGLVGDSENSATITNCYATGSVSGSSNVGGLTGFIYASINQCYATGSVSGSSNVGGLVGSNPGSLTIAGSYWDVQTSSQSSSTWGVGLTTAAMQRASSFVGWDFTTTWVIYAGYVYPLLQALIFPPVLSNPLSNVTLYVGSLLEFTIPTNIFTDPNGLQLTYNVELLNGSPLPPWLSFKPSTQTFVGTPLSGTQGILTVEVSVYNLPTQSISDSFQLIIPDRPPMLNAPFIPQVALNGQPFQFIVPTVTFFDPDGDHLQLSAALPNSTSLPSWLNFNEVLWIFSGTSTHRGNVRINVTANDGFGGQVSALLQIITPNTAPTATATFPNQVVVIAQLFSFTLPANIFFDLDGDPLIYSATLFGGGQLLPWLSFNAQTLTFQGTPDATGFLMLAVIATDPYNATASLNFGVSVSALSGNAPPLLAIQMLDQTATVNQLFTLALPQNMFIDTNGNPLTYSAMLEGGTPLPSWLNFSATSLVFSGVAPTTGNLHITVRADNGGGFALDTFTLTITSSQNLPPFLQNPISNQAVAVGENYQFTLPSNTFIDVNDAPLTYSASTSGNGPLPGWLHFNANTRTFSGTPSDTDTNLYAPRITMIEVRANNGIGSAVTTFQLSVTGKSQAETIVNALITLASVASAAFAVYRNRALLWNAFFKKRYEKGTKKIALNELFSYQFTAPADKIKLVKAFNKTSSARASKKPGGCLKWVSFNPYQELPDNNSLPKWLNFDRDTLTLSGTPTKPIDLYICAEGFDGRYLEAFPLRCETSKSKDVEMHQI